MLGLDQTALLLDALRPPPGMEIDVAVGTTFTLDLAALLAVPVAASFGEREDDEEPADLLETIRRYADRTVLFCQAGAISVPPYRAALTFVEQTVVEVAKPKGGIFHPKTWVVRFSGRGQQRHRVLVMSRNLTFDRAWDVLVRLDEEPECEAAVRSRPFAAFLGDAGNAAARPLTTTQRTLVSDLQASLSHARLAVPPPFTEGSLVTLKPGGRTFPFHPSCDHALAISPFLTSEASASFLDTATEWSGVVSRAAALDGVASALGDVDDVYRIKDAMLDAQGSVDDAFGAGEAVAGGELVQHTPQMRGLHAKIFVQDVGDEATVWLGSANLTDAAMTRNWETLVRLSGPTRLVGYDVVLSPKPQQGNLSWLVEEHLLRDGEDGPDRADGVSPLEGRLYDLASRSITLTLHEENDRWRADLDINPWDLPDGVVVRARLLSQFDAMPVVSGTAAWSALALHQITPFVVLELSADTDVRRALVRADLRGDDYEQRRGAVLAHAISNREDFLRYLAALLGLTFGGIPGGGDGPAMGAWIGGAGGDRVLEDLLTTASRSPQRLASLEQTLARLEKDERFSQIVPDDFRDLWRAVYRARKAVIR